MSNKHPAEVLADRMDQATAHGSLYYLDVPARIEIASILRRIPALEAERADAIAQQAAALDLVARIRQALGDDGRRMQDELIEWCRTLVQAEAERDAAKKSLSIVQRHHATAWNRGHAAGLRAARDTVRQATAAVQADAWGNARLTDALMAAETERDALRAEVERQLQALRVAVVALAGASEHRPEFRPAYTVVSDTIAARSKA